MFTTAYIIGPVSAEQSSRRPFGYRTLDDAPLASRLRGTDRATRQAMLSGLQQNCHR